MHFYMYIYTPTLRKYDVWKRVDLIKQNEPTALLHFSVPQVLDEIGIEVQQKLSGVGVANDALPQQQRTKVGADTSDIEARLRQLQDP